MYYIFRNGGSMSKGLSKRQKKEVHKFALANWKVLLAIFLILVVLCVVAYYLGWFEKLKNYFDKDDEPVMSVAGGHETRVERLEDLQVNFLDIGQGDCIIIELPDGKNMIIDSGENLEDLDLLVKIKKIQNFVTTKVIVTSTIQDKTTILNHGADLYLPKPYEITDLIRWVEYFMQA